MCKLHQKRLKKATLHRQEWDADYIRQGWEVIKQISDQYNWDTYDIQFEILDPEQFMAKTTTTGLPFSYAHWSFGKEFLSEMEEYKNGVKHGDRIYAKGLPYEMVINSDPSICYLNSHNSPCMQLIVTAHACSGHVHFFKNNYLFKQHTQPKHIVNYMEYARQYIADCEEKHGAYKVEAVLDIAHTLANLSVFKTDRSKKSNLSARDKDIIRLKHKRDNFNEITDQKPSLTSDIGIFEEENILYYAEKRSNHADWVKEIFRIVRNIEQYFYPQGRTKLINEGFAQFTEHTIMNELYDRGFITVGYMLEYIQDNGGVMYQADSTGKKRSNGQLDFHSINPYYLGYQLMKDIKRMCVMPTDEDKYYMSHIAGRNWVDVINGCVSDFNDESAILQFLSPHLIKKLRMFHLHTTEELDHYLIKEIHGDSGWQDIRNTLSDQYNIARYTPDIFICKETEDTVFIRHRAYKNNRLNIEENAAANDSILYALAYAFNKSVTILDVNDEIISKLIL